MITGKFKKLFRYGWLFVVFSIVPTVSAISCPSGFARNVRLILGIICLLFGIGTACFNHHASLNFDGSTLTVRCGWFFQKSYPISSIDFVLAQPHMLIIAAKNRKPKAVPGLENSYEVCSMLRAALPHIPAAPEDLVFELDFLKKRRKKYIKSCILCFALLFLSLALTAFLTDSKDIPQFSESDIIIFTAMVFMCIELVILAFVLAEKAGTLLWITENTRYRLARAVMETNPLPAGNVSSVYIDVNHTVRVVIFSFPDTSQIYVTLEHFEDDCTLSAPISSSVYEDNEDFSIEFPFWIDITHMFKKSTL